VLCVDDDDVDKNGWTVMISVKEVPSETHSTIPRMSEVHPMNETMRSFWPYIPRVAKGKMGRMANTGDKNKRMVYVCRLCVWYVVDYGWRVRRLTLGVCSGLRPCVFLMLGI
jgi:hypothetical protein